MGCNPNGVEVNQVDCDACTEGAKKKCNGVEKLPDAPKDWRMCTFTPEGTAGV